MRQLGGVQCHHVERVQHQIRPVDAACLCAGRDRRKGRFGERRVLRLVYKWTILTVAVQPLSVSMGVAAERPHLPAVDRAPKGAFQQYRDSDEMHRSGRLRCCHHGVNYNGSSCAHVHQNFLDKHAQGGAGGIKLSSRGEVQSYRRGTRYSVTLVCLGHEEGEDARHDLVTDRDRQQSRRLRSGCPRAAAILCGESGSKG